MILKKMLDWFQSLEIQIISKSEFIHYVYFYKKNTYFLTNKYIWISILFLFKKKNIKN